MGGVCVPHEGICPRLCLVERRGLGPVMDSLLFNLPPQTVADITERHTVEA